MSDFAWKNRGLPAAFLLVVLLLSGCATKVGLFNSASYGSGDCQQLWQDLEEVIHANQVADSRALRIEGFPYLRSTRYLQALADRAASPAAQGYVLEEMRRLDLATRALELSRIPAHVFAAFDRPALSEELAACSRGFLAADNLRPHFFDQVRGGMDLDRDYSLWLRSVGLYPLTSLVVDFFAEGAMAEMVAELRSPVDQAAAKNLLTFRPSGIGSATLPNLDELLGRSRRNPLLSLEIAQEDLAALANRFAPLLTIADGAPHDRFGRIVRLQGQFAVDGSDPVVYYYFSQTFVQGIPALQINYVLWFAERAQPAPWFEQGTLDGLIVRVTLNWQGQPIFVDVAFQCGCYHFVLFDDNLVSGKLPEAKAFQPFVGGTLPELQAGERLQFSIKSGWHQIGQVSTALPGLRQPTYQLLPYEGLEYFVDGDEVVSLFGTQGRVPGTNRLERFFLFPMGIPEVGAMRQRGRQPITLIGRAYLDDPYLFDNAFGYRFLRPAVADLIPGEIDGQNQENGEKGMSSADKAKTGNEK